MPLIGLQGGLAGIISKRNVVSVPPPANEYDPPAGWVPAATMNDNFVRTAQTGQDSLDPALWKHRNFGRYFMHNAAWSDNANQIEATGSTIKVHVKKVGTEWRTDGWLGGSQNTAPAEYGYNVGLLEFHHRFRMRMSHYISPGVGGYHLSWEASGNWGQEFDWVETPGYNKSRCATVMHWDSTGNYDLGSNNEQSYVNTDIDLTEWHVWDCRRTFKTINGIVHATIEVWIDGVKLIDPGGWTDNRWMTRPVVHGPAGFVARTDIQGVVDWYSAPSAESPTSSHMEFDYMLTWVPSSGTQPVTKTISFSPANPGTLTETSTGSGAPWTTSIVSQGITSVSWVKVAPNFAFIEPITTLATTGSVSITPTFTATGQFIKAYETNNLDNVVVNSGAVTLNAPAQTGRSIALNPQNPGSRAAGPLATTVTTTGITNITWALVNPDFTWVSNTSVATSGTVTVSPNYTTTGQFLKVFDTNDASFVVDGGAVTIT